jgi:hypothetical protein
MLVSLWLPILLSGVALFFVSFLSWMVLQLHKLDWMKLEREDELLAALRGMNISRGNYMFPACNDPQEMKTPDFQEKWKRGPRGIMTVFGETNMGAKMAMTFALFLVTALIIAYLSTIGLARGAERLDVFRFFSTAGLLAFLPGIVQHSIWFRCRIVGHLIESILYALILGGIFAALWPG